MKLEESSMATVSERTITATEADKQMATESSRILEPLAARPHDLKLELLDEDMSRQFLNLPAPAVRALSQILKELAKGNSVTLVPNDAMLSTQEAADILNVSRPFVVSLLEAGKIPYQRLGSHRRILFRDLMAFKQKSDASGDEAMRQLTQEAQELGLGY
jgi:excisionase family DNA binding protein